MWIQEQLEPNQPISNIPIVLEINGYLSISALSKSINSIIVKHEILRTIYFIEDGKPRQKILSPKKISIPVIDVHDLSSDEVNDIISDEANKCFNIEKDLMIRVMALKISDSKYKVIITQHHLASDAWSLNLLIGELGEFYKAYLDGHNEQEIQLNYPYCLYSEWENDLLKTEYINGQLDYWKNKLSNCNDGQPLPLDKPRGNKRIYNGSFYRFSVDRSLRKKAIEFCEENNITLFMLLIGTFNLLLMRYSNQYDFNVGTLVANRNHKEIENTLGFFINTLVIRTTPDKHWNIKDFFNNVKINCLEAFNCQDVPFDMVVDSLKTERNAQLNPLFQVLFTLQNALDTKINLPGLDIIASDYDRSISKFDITLNFSEIDNNLAGLFEYNTDLFYEETIAQLGNHYISLLDSIINNPEQKITNVEFLLPQELHILHNVFNDTYADLPHPVNIIDIFQDQVIRNPDNIAVIIEDQMVTYRDLNTLSNQIAHVLIQRGLKKGNNAAIYLPRSIEYLVCMLSILKTGATFVPLDIKYPKTRTMFMINDANVKLVMTRSECIRDMDLEQSRYLCLDLITNEINSSPIQNIDIHIEPDDVAYLMYTSGSTGDPKAVMTPHRGVVRCVKNTNYVNITDKDTLLQISPLVFDGSTFDIWGALLNGAKLILTPEGLPELKKLANLIDKHRITIAFMTTQLFNLLVDHYLPTLCQLERIFFGGERTCPEHVLKFLKHDGKCSLFNVYGPTETTVFASFHPITEVDMITSTVPIGKPITNTQLYVVDSELQILP